MRLETLPNSELLELLRDDGQAAFNEVYRRFWRTLYALSYNRLRDQHKAEDIVHDVLASLWSRRKTSAINNLDAYLATAVKFRILESIRKESIQQNYIKDVPVIEMQTSYDISESVHFKRLLQAVNEEVERLPQQCKLVFKYSREQHMPVKQIAETMDLSTSTVENHLNKALKRLQLVVKKLGSQILLSVAIILN